MYVKHNETIEAYIINNPSIDTFGFKNIWSHTNYFKLSDSFPGTFQCSKTIYKFTWRSKCIHRLSSIDIINIHCPIKNITI
jgi:hypothetical protein